jgi:hypothetical protein
MMDVKTTLLERPSVRQSVHNLVIGSVVLFFDTMSIGVVAAGLVIKCCSPSRPGPGGDSLSVFG